MIPSKTFYCIKLVHVKGSKTAKKQDYELEKKFKKLRNTRYESCKNALIDAIRWNYERYSEILDDEDDENDHDCLYAHNEIKKRFLKKDRFDEDELYNVRTIHERILDKIKMRASKNCGLLWFAYVKSINNDLY